MVAWLLGKLCVSQNSSSGLSESKLKVGLKSVQFLFQSLCVQIGCFLPFYFILRGSHNLEKFFNRRALRG